MRISETTRLLGRKKEHKTILNDSQKDQNLISIEKEKQMSLNDIKNHLVCIQNEI